MRKSSKIIALLVTLVMLVCALAVAINASTGLPEVTVSDKTNSYDMKALEQQIFADEGVYYRYNSSAQLGYSGNELASRFITFEGLSTHYIDKDTSKEDRKAMTFYSASDANRLFESWKNEQVGGDAVIEVTGTEANHYLRLSGTKAGESTMTFAYDIASYIIVNSSSTNVSAAVSVFDFDFTADRYVKQGGGLTTDIAEAENGGKLAYSELNSICFLLEGSGVYGKMEVSFEYDESSNTWYACYGEGKLPLRPELGAWNHITIVCVPYSLSSDPAKSDVNLATYAYLDGEFIGSYLPFGEGPMTNHAYPELFGFTDKSPYTADDMSLCFDNIAVTRYKRLSAGTPTETDLANQTCKITYADLFTRDANQVHPETLNGTIPAIVSGWGSAGAPSDGRTGKLSYSVYSDEYVYPAGTTYAATITRGTDVDGFYALSQAVANLQADDTLTIKSGLTLNYKGNVSFTAVCDEGAITLPRDSEMALVRTTNGYKVVAQSTIDEVAHVQLFPTYEDYEDVDNGVYHDFIIIQGAPIDPEDADGVNYPDHYVWIVADGDGNIIAKDLSASDLATAEMIANAAFIYPAPKASITVNWYASKDAATPFATETYKDGETIVAPDTTGVEGLDGVLPFNDYVDLIFGGTFADVNGVEFVTGTTASASVDYYAVIDTPQIKAEYAKMAYVNYKLSARQAVGILYAPITSEEGVEWSFSANAKCTINGKAYGVVADNLYTNYSGHHNQDTNKTVTVTVNGKTSAPVTIVVPQFANYLKYIIEHEDAYTAAERQLALDLTQFHALQMVALSPALSGRFVDVVYQAHKTECTDISKLTFEGDTKYDAPETLPAGVKGITLVLANEGWIYSSWRFAIEVEDGFDMAANLLVVEYITWDVNGKPTTDRLDFNEKVTIDGKTYITCKDNPNRQPMATMTEDVTIKVCGTEFNYNLATYIQNVEAAGGDATLARAMYAFSKTLYAYVTAPVD